MPFWLFLRIKPYSLLLAFMLLSSCQLGALTQKDPKAGQPAFDFYFEEPNGNLKKLSDFYDKKILLIFWSTWCEVCKNELPELNQLASKDTDLNVLTIAIRDQKERWKNFVSTLTEYNLKFGFADTKQILDKYKGTGVPEGFFISPQGKFLQVYDTDGSKSIRIVGPKPWKEPKFYKQFIVE